MLEIRMKLCAQQSKLQTGVDAGMEAVSGMGIELERDKLDMSVDELELKTAALQDMHEERYLIAIRILCGLVSSAYALSDTDLLKQIAFTCVNISLQHGKSGETAFAVVVLGLTRWNETRYADAYRCGE